ncbi:hypothetical protein FRC06_009747 [Ceratobasidium sp. 370]|nr:hypothetical protein FRC06_009747 [Ceratobasidium sp. 370]
MPSPTQRIYHLRARCSALSQGTPTTNSLNNPMAGVVAEADQDSQGSIPQPEPAALHGQVEVTPVLLAPHTPLLVSEHAAPAPFVLPAPAPMPAPALLATPVGNTNLNINLNPNAAQPTLMGSLQGVGGIQFTDDEVPENPAAEVPAGQNIQEPIILPGHIMSDEAAFPHAPFVQPFAAVPAVDVVVQPFVPVAGDNPVQQPLLRSLRGFEDIQFEDEGEGEDD